MRYVKILSIVFGTLVILFTGCHQQESTQATTSDLTVSISHSEVSVDSVEMDRNRGMALYQGVPFTGVSVAFYEDGIVAEKITYSDGERNGLRKKWFRTGLLSYQANYQANKLHGEVKTWWSNGHLRSLSNYQSGVADGIQQEWYVNGQLFKEINLVAGQEEGLQRAWRQNGKLYVNYEAKHGRIFGLKRASLCYELNDENIVSND
ncbi:MAG: toxin-antitoxin system YwqK family antitoxin [Cyclobacteriaceae bacterium]